MNKIKLFISLGILQSILITACFKTYISIADRGSSVNDPPQTTNEVIVQQLVKTTRSWDDSMLPHYPSGQPEITILKIIIPPKTTLPLHYHPVINAGVLLTGKLTVITEKDEKLYLKAGDPIVEVVNKIHYGKNEGDTPAEIIVFYAGISNSPITIKKP